MRDLDTGQRTLLLHERNHGFERVALGIRPQPQTAGGDAALGADAGGFDDHQCCAADCAAAEMYHMPRVRHAVDGRVLAHGRDEDTVFEHGFAHFERAEESGHGERLC